MSMYVCNKIVIYVHSVGTELTSENTNGPDFDFSDKDVLYKVMYETSIQNDINMCYLRGLHGDTIICFLSPCDLDLVSICTWTYVLCGISIDFLFSDYVS